MSTPSRHEQKLIAVGTHNVRAPCPSSLEEYQWDINNLNQVTFTSGQLLKFTYRHAPKNESLESVFLDYKLQNNGAVDVDVLPLWAGSVREMRVYINNKKVIDWNREEQCRSNWNHKLLTDYDTDRMRDNYYHVSTGEAAAFDAVTVPAGQFAQFHLNFKDIWEGFSSSLPLTKVGLIEVEMNLSSRGDFVCNPQAAVADLVLNDVTVYSRHKQYGAGRIPPTVQSSFTFTHYDYDVFTLSPSQHPFGAVGAQEYDLNISTEFPKRAMISRLIVFSRDPADPNAYRNINSGWVSSMELLRGGITLLGTEYHYDTRRKIYKEASNWLQRHHSIAYPTNPGDGAIHGQTFFTNFIDCTTVQHNQNESARADIKNKELSSLDNFANLVLRIRSDGAVVLSPTAQVVCLLEYPRFDRLLGNGQVVKISNVGP